jgi:hypothetical protein
MTLIMSSAAWRKSDISISSTGIGPAGWRGYWCRQSVIDGTDWRTLINVTDAALGRLRRGFISGCSSFAPGTRP